MPDTEQPVNSGWRLLLRNVGASHPFLEKAHCRDGVAGACLDNYPVLASARMPGRFASLSNPPVIKVSHNESVKSRLKHISRKITEAVNESCPLEVQRGIAENT